MNTIKQVIPNETIVKIVGSITDPAKQVGPAGLPNRYKKLLALTKPNFNSPLVELIVL